MLVGIPEFDAKTGVLTFKVQTLKEAEAFDSKTGKSVHVMEPVAGPIGVNIFGKPATLRANLTVKAGR